MLLVMCLLMFGCSIFIIILWLLCSVVVCIWVIEVEVSVVLLKWVNSVVIGCFSLCLMMVCVLVLGNGGIWFCSRVSLLVMLVGIRLWWVESIWLVLMKIGFRLVIVLCRWVLCESVLILGCGVLKNGCISLSG